MPLRNPRSLKPSTTLRQRVLSFTILLLFLSSMLVSLNCNHDEEGDGALPGSQLAKVGIVLRLGEYPAWDAGMVESPAVWFDSTQGRYGMVYSGYELTYPGKAGYRAVSRAQVGLAWSDDLIGWEKDPRNPIFGPSGLKGAPDEAGTTGPLIWFEGGTYYLYYIGTTAAGYERGVKTLNLATSNDLINWKRYERNPIIRPRDGWRRDAIWHPNIVKVDETYYLFFNASGVVNGLSEEFIGYATSKDLLTWEVDDVNSPVLVGSAVEGNWDSSGRAGDPSLYRVGERWFMAYYSWDGTHAQDGLAWTTAERFPLGWRVYERNPVLRIGPPGTYDALHASKPFIVRVAHRHFHFYTAVDAGEKREIALAIWPPLQEH